MTSICTIFKKILYMGRSELDLTDDFQNIYGLGLDRTQLFQTRNRTKNFTVRLSLVPAFA